MIKKTLAAAAVVGSAMLFAIAGAGPAMAAPEDELVVNGHFDQTRFWKDNGRWYPGEKLGAWDINEYNDGPRTDLPTVIVWNKAMEGDGPTMAAPFTYGSWIRVMVSISQTIPTEANKVYTLTYLSRASGSDANDMANGWDGGNLSRVLIDGDVVDSFRTVVTEDHYTKRTVTFTATSESTVLTLANSGGGAVGFDEVSVVEVPVNDSPVMVPAIAGGIGLAALAAGGVAFSKRKSARTGR